tara:strand:- start:1399 stop:1836 length:438 start_codon:yes stop_codon:yes gene_type:complete
MTKYISIDPGKCKCGLIFVDFESKEILKAIVIESKLLIKNIKTLRGDDNNIKVIIGNGTTSKEHINSLFFLGSDLTVVEEKNTTLRAKERYFEIFPIKGFRRFLPKDILINDINLDAISALVILEDYLHFKFTLSWKERSKTWMK